MKLIECKNVSKRFGEKVALDNVFSKLVEKGYYVIS